MQKEKLRTFDSLKEFFALLCATFKRMMRLGKIPPEKKISPQFREKLMIAVSSVNKCSYCSFLHTRIALEQGITQKEIDDILKNDTELFPKEDFTGILFAQHFAETKGNISEDALHKVIQTYGEQKTTQIMAFLQSVLFGNLCCNTYVSYKTGLLTQEEKNRICLAYFFSIPVARMIYKKSRRAKE